MYKYIGIRGHRGAGKNTVAKLLGIMLDSLTHFETEDKFEEIYKQTAKSIIDDEGYTLNTTDVHFETFADTPITMVHMIFGIPMEYCYSDFMKDAVIINLKTFEYIIALDKKPDVELTSAHTYFETRNSEIDCEPSPKKINGDVYMTLRELISYYGNYVMKYFFGANTWLKSLQSTQRDMDEFYTGSDLVYKIYTDVKFTSEVDYIKERDGIIINLIRKNKDKGNYETSTNLTFDDRVDYVIEYDDVMDDDAFNQIKQIAIKIYENTGK